MKIEKILVERARTKYVTKSAFKDIITFTTVLSYEISF